MKNTRVPGHGLIAEGAAFDADGRRVFFGGVGGYGHAHCSCGEVSSFLASSTDRKIWHRAHKAGHRSDAPTATTKTKP